METEPFRSLEHERTFDFVGQFANVARPGMGVQTSAALGGQGWRLDVVPRTDPRHHDLRQPVDVVSALAQRWNAHAEQIKPVQQILAKSFLRHQPPEIGVGRGDDADIDLLCLVGAHAADSVIVDRGQQLGLQGQ